MRAVRAVIGAVGELILTAGVVLLLFVVWQLGIVGLIANRDQAGTVATLERTFAAPQPTTGATAPVTSSPATPNPPPQPAPGTAFAILRIPRLGASWAKPVLQGVGLDVLAQGLGHYPDTQLPGQIGNVGLAGHRAGHGNPLIDIDTIQPGDVLVVETAEAFLVYRASTHQIVVPTDIAVIAPVPGQPGATASEASLTLTSCDPKYGSTNRYIVVARLDRTIPHDQGLPPELLAPPGKDA